MLSRRSYAWVCGSLLGGAVGCAGPTRDPGLSAQLQVEGAQYVHGAMPEDGDGPAVVSAQTEVGEIVVGGRAQRLYGTLAAEARGVSIGLPGDRGFWTLPAGPPDPLLPTLLSFDVLVTLSSSVPPGDITLRVLAANAAGLFGVATAVPWKAAEQPAPEGELVVSLIWDRNVDLDLRVVDPNGSLVWWRSINSTKRPRPGDPPLPPEALQQGGILDFDSNPQCQIDGRNRENIVWKTAPPAGRYTVRVDNFSLCSESAVAWRVEVFWRGERLQVVRGFGDSLQTRFDHGPTGGIEATTFEIGAPP